MQTDFRSRPRRRHEAQFKAEVVSACSAPDANVAEVARSFGLNDNLVVHDGVGVWCAARRLNAGRFVWLPSSCTGAPALELGRAQFDALVPGLPWQRLTQDTYVVSEQLRAVGASSRAGRPARARP